MGMRLAQLVNVHAWTARGLASLAAERCNTPHSPAAAVVYSPGLMPGLQPLPACTSSAWTGLNTRLYEAWP